MSRRSTIALDAMGGDHGPAVIVPAALAYAREPDAADLILVGDRDALHAAGARERAGLRIRHASQCVAMDEPPAQALRLKKDSSMRVALDLVKTGEADACVSAGNTGALMATARYVLKTLAGIERPAIISAIPNIAGHTQLLDLGANVDSSAEHLMQFAVMGAVLAEAVDGLTRPRVGLLNIGQEDIKGNEQVKEAARLLAASPLHYVGYVEGDGIYSGAADVVVCDGFVGNVALKSSEGVARLLKHDLQREFRRNALTRLAALTALPVLKRVRARFDPGRYNGASLLGLNGIVIKSHGGADVFAFGNAIRCAATEVRQCVPQRIRDRVEALLTQRRAS